LRRWCLGELAAHQVGWFRLVQGHPEGATGSDVGGCAERVVDDLGVPGAKRTAGRRSDKAAVVEVADTSVPEMVNV
jgi:hypothetical protein